MLIFLIHYNDKNVTGLISPIRIRGSLSSHGAGQSVLHPVRLAGLFLHDPLLQPLPRKDHHSHGILYEVSDSHGILHEVSDPHGILHEVSDSHGILHEESDPHGILHEESDSHGILHEESDSHGILHEVSDSHGILHEVSNSHGILHEVSDSHGILHEVSNLRLRLTVFNGQLEGFRKKVIINKTSA